MDIASKDLFNNTELFIKIDPTSRLGFYAAKIAYYNFEWRFITLVMFNTIGAIGLQTFLQNYNQTAIVKKGRYVPKHRVAVPQFVIFGAEANEISTTINWLVKVKYDINSKFIIICASQTYDECDEQKIFETLAKNFVLNVVLLKQMYANTKAVAYSYEIVSPGKCRTPQPYEIDLFTDCQNDTCFSGLYPEKATNFYGCRLVISTVEQPPFMYLHNGTKPPSGTDGDILKVVADMLNATLVLKTPTDGTDMGHFENNNWTGSLGDIYNIRVHASACTAPLTSNKYGNFQISFTYYSMDIVWACRLPTEQASWEKLLHPLKFEVRIILLVIFVGITILNSLKDTDTCRNFRGFLHVQRPKYNVLFYSWILFLGLPINMIPKNTSFRILIFTWIWFCFILRCAYQAGLIYSLKHTDYMDNLQSFQEALSHGYPYGGLASVRDYYHEDHDIYDNWTQLDLDNTYKTLDDILEGSTDFVIAANKEIVKHRIMKYNGTKQLQIIPEKIINSPTVVYFKKYSPLTSPISYALRIATESGIIQRFYRRYLDRDKDLLKRFQSQRPEPITLYHFAGCFAILIIGWFISGIYFAVEYICGNLNEEKNMKRSF